MHTPYEEGGKSVDTRVGDALSESEAVSAMPPVTSESFTGKTPIPPPDSIQSTNEKNNPRNHMGERSSRMEKHANYGNGQAFVKGDDDNKKNNNGRTSLAPSSAHGTSHSRSKSRESHSGNNTADPRPFPTGKRRGKMWRELNSYWRLPLKRRSIGQGTVGLHEMSNDSDIPAEAKACINGTLVVGSPSHVRKVREYIKWREKHGDLFSTMRTQDEKERMESHKQRLLKAERQRQMEEGAYEAAVTRMRHRGWSVLGDTPRPVDHERQMQIQAQREAIRAECEGVAARKMLEASKLRENIAHDLALQREKREEEQRIVRDAARAEREQWLHFREQREAQLRERAEAMRAERNAEREYNRACLTVDAATWRQYVASTRDRVLTRVSTPDPSSPPNDWRRTFRSPVKVPQNAGDDAVRRAWVAELLNERRAVAAATVARVRNDRAALAVEGGVCGAMFREKCARAEAVRAEAAALRERRERQLAEMAEGHRAALADRRRQREAIHEAQRRSRSSQLGRGTPDMESPFPES